MDPRRTAQLWNELAQADRHIADGHARIAKQRILLDGLQQDSQDAELAKRYLGALEVAQGVLERHRAHVLRDLGRNLPKS
jgi:hypothetical protein